MFFHRKYNETEMAFSWMRVAYAPSGIPVGGIAPELEPYSMPLWTIRWVWVGVDSRVWTVGGIAQELKPYSMPLWTVRWVWASH